MSQDILFNNKKSYTPVPDSYLNKLQWLRYSKSTISVYSYMFRQFVSYCNQQQLNINTIDKIGIENFVRKQVLDKKLAVSTQNQMINAIKFYYEKVQTGKRTIYELDRPIKPFTLPKVLSEQEVSRVLQVTHNKKHKTMLSLLYSAGLRVGELLNLRIEDIDSDRMLINIRGAKGNKDRTTLLSNIVLEMLREYYKISKPKK